MLFMSLRPAPCSAASISVRRRCGSSANNVTIKDCTFSGTTSYWAVYQSPNASGATVENCTFQGTKSPTETNVSWITSVLGITIKDNSFLDTPWDAIDLGSGGVIRAITSPARVTRRARTRMRFGSLSSTGPTTITDNFIDGTTNTDAPVGENSDIRLTTDLGNLNDVTVSGNYLLGGNYTVEASSTTYKFTNVSVANNYIGFDTFGPYYPTTAGLASVTGNTIVDFTNPT